jgi:hypothetical protein
VRVGKRLAAFDLGHCDIVLPNLDYLNGGFRIAHISDLHIGLCTPTDRLRLALKCIADEEPDIVAITGDLITRHWPFLEGLDILRELPCPTFVTLGNHELGLRRQDPLAVCQIIESYGHVVLRNESVSIPLRTARLFLSGVEDESPAAMKCLQETAYQAGKDPFVVLAHKPRLASLLPENSASVVLTGHTHGGHFVLPGITRPLFWIMREPLMEGFHNVRGNWVHVSRGLGYGAGFLPRFRARPEVTIFTLRAASNDR